LFTAKNGKSVDSPFTDQEAFLLCKSLKKEFPQSLCASYQSKKGPSEQQLVWMHILAVEATAKPAPEKAQPTLTFAGATTLVALFEKASGHLKYPKIRIAASDGRKLVFYRAGPKSAVPGSIVVTDGVPKVEGGKWFGRIGPDGAFSPTAACDDDLLAFITAFGADPLGVARRYGRLHGNCCFCGKKLTTEESTTAGYGPDCAEHWSLPWGQVVHFTDLEEAA